MNDIPSWHEYFLNIADVVSTRSPDPSTKHGCVLVKDKRIIGTGYNGPPPDLHDEKVPLTRPEKYPWMKHSEKNALHNRTINTAGFTAYITGEPCFHCLTDLYCAGCNEVVYGSRGSHCIDDADYKLKEHFFSMLKSGFHRSFEESFTRIVFF